MTKIKNILSESVACFVGTIEDARYSMRFLEYLKYNSTWLPHFHKIVLSMNSSTANKSYLDNTLTMAKALPHYKDNDIELLFGTNIGPVFGAMDNDCRFFDYICNKPEYKYIFKFSLDTIAASTFLDMEIDIDKYDFFYINNIGYAALQDRTKIELQEDILNQKYFLPQTNYYIVKNQIKQWYPNKEEIGTLQSKFKEIQKEHPEYQPWDAIPDCACENMLAKTIKNNNLRCGHLLSEQDTKKIIDLIDEVKENDGSHKNIVYSNAGGLCHFHYISYPVATI